MVGVHVDTFGMWKWNKTIKLFDLIQLTLHKHLVDCIVKSFCCHTFIQKNLTVDMTDEYELF